MHSSERDTYNTHGKTQVGSGPRLTLVSKPRLGGSRCLTLVGH